MSTDGPALPVNITTRTWDPLILNSTSPFMLYAANFSAPTSLALVFAHPLAEPALDAYDCLFTAAFVSASAPGFSLPTNVTERPAPDRMVCRLDGIEAPARDYIGQPMSIVVRSKAFPNVSTSLPLYYRDDFYIVNATLALLDAGLVREGDGNTPGFNLTLFGSGFFDIASFVMEDPKSGALFPCRRIDRGEHLS